MMLWLYVCLSSLIISITHWLFRWMYPKSVHGKLPPGSMGYPVIGETLEFFKRSYSLDVPPFIQKRTDRYGSLFKTNLVGSRVVVSTDPKFNQFIFQQEGRLFSLWYMDSFMEIFRQDGLSSSNIFTHKYFKSLVMEILGHENLKEKLLPEVEMMVSNSLRSWSKHSVVDVEELTKVMLFDLSSKKLISYDSKKSTVGLRELFNGLLKNLISFPLHVPGTGFYKCKRAKENILEILRAMLQERMEKRRADHQTRSRGHGEGDFLDRVLDEINKDEKERMLNEETGLTLLFLLLFASYETTSLALTLAIKLITDHPSVLDHLTEEHEAILRRREYIDSSITWEEYKSMAFTSQVIDETLRLANIAPVMVRRAMRDIEINGYTIPEGWAVMVSPPATHLDPAKYEDPLAFNPWRWEGKKSETLRKDYMAFGGGMRLCAGSEFAKMEIAIFLHFLVTKYRWRVIKGGEITRSPGLGFPNGLHIQVSAKQP